MRLNKRWLIILGALAAIALFAAFALKRNSPTRYFTAQAERGDVREVVEATGTINAVTSVQVGSQVSGRISELHADFNSRVHEGEVIARIDPSLFEGALLQARADLENARANSAAAKANLERARATAAQARAQYARTQKLAEDGVMSQQQLEVAKADAESADAQVNAGEAQVEQARAQVKQREAAVEVAETNLRHTIIRAPIDGIVVSRDVDVGQTVAASLQAPTLFTIAQNLTKMQVYAKTDESDVGKIRPGLPVTFTVDAYPLETFQGEVVQVRMNATTVQNVVTYDTVIEFANPAMKLFPGMTAYVSIPVATADDVLTVPNAALRYKPDLPAEQVRTLYRQAGIQMGGQRRPQSEAGNASAGNSSPEEARPAVSRMERQQHPGGGSAADSLLPTGPSPDVATVWKLDAADNLLPVQIRTGITDRTITEVRQVLAGELKSGDRLVTSEMRAQSGPGAANILGGSRRR